MMRRLLPAPLLSAALVALWLVLNASLAVGDVLLALLLGLAVPVLLAPLRPARPRMRHPWTVLRLIDHPAAQVPAPLHGRIRLGLKGSAGAGRAYSDA